MPPLDSMRHDAFRDAYRKLEQKMESRAEDDGDVFLPSAAPSGPVDFVLICMEPSLGSNSADQVRERVRAGSRNFLHSVEDFILHFSAHTYLCGPTKHYHVTDWSEGAMRVKVAREARDRRYARWYLLLLEEVQLVSAPNAGFVAVGGVVAKELQRRNFRGPLCEVLHYSGQAARARKAFVAERKASFEAFRETVSLRDVRATAEEVLRSANVLSAFSEEALGRLDWAQLTESRKQLVFHYKVKFESFRAQLKACP